MSESEKCPICQINDVAVERIRVSGLHQSFACPFCGRFAIRVGARDGIPSDVRSRGKLAAVTQNAVEPLLLNNEHQGLDVPGFVEMAIEQAIRLFPADIGERLDLALLNIADMSLELGHCVQLSRILPFEPKVYTLSVRELDYIAGAIEALGYAEVRRPRSRDEAQFVQIVVTPAGWARVAELRSSGPGSGIGFIAMWFGAVDSCYVRDPLRSRTSRAFCDELHSAIACGVEAAWYRPKRIDLEEFTGDVVDRVLARIRGSRFVVADFTGHRGGVYFEAGFALGLGRTLIYTCHEADLGAAHFDVRNMNTIAWKNFDELTRRLAARIEALIGRGPIRPEN